MRASSSPAQTPRWSRRHPESWTPPRSMSVTIVNFTPPERPTVPLWGVNLVLGDLLKGPDFDGSPNAGSRTLSTFRI